MNKQIIKAVAVLTSSLAASNAFAHASLVAREAPAENYYVAQMQIPHGCDGQATNAVSIKLPEGFISAKPMPKAGWTLEIVKGDYQKTYDNHGEVKSGPIEIIWKDGDLPNDFYDVFTIMGKISGVEPGTALPFIVTQTCADGKVEWNEIAKEGVDAHSLKHPAPLLNIVEGGHQHH